MNLASPDSVRKPDPSTGSSSGRTRSSNDAQPRWWPSDRRSPKIANFFAGAALNASLALFVSVSFLSLLRIFLDARLQTPIVIGLAAGLGVPALARVLRVPTWFAIIASTIVEVVVLGVWFASRKSVPFNLDTASLAKREMIDALQQVNRIVAPSPSLIGFGIVVGLVAWVVSLTADVMCFGIPAPLGALVTPGAVAISAAIISPRKGSTHQDAWVLALVVALSLYLIAIGLHDRVRQPSWFARHRGSLVGTAAVLVLAFGGFGVVATSTTKRLAIDDRQPSLNWRVSDRSRNERVITSPLVSLQRRILKQSDNEQFSVESRDIDGNDRPSYWRLTALDDFNGESWQSTGEFRRIGSNGKIRSTQGGTGSELSQKFLIAELDTESLPAAFVPVSYLGNVDGISYAEGTTTLLYKTALQQGTQYQITSSVPSNLELTDLERYDISPAPDDPNIQLPDTFPARVRDLATEVTKAQPTTIQKARALQDFFRTQFEYSLDVPAGSSEPALERFLFSDRRGYCEQFAGAFAAMARSIGIPARVAVGFTPGRFDPADRRYHVTGKNSHAWPEIQLADGSWFPFEPTPGRGFPGLTETTGVNTQDSSESPATPAPTIPTPTATEAPTTTVAPTQATPPTPRPSSNRWPWALGLVVLLMFVALAVFVYRRRPRRPKPQAPAPLTIIRQERSVSEVRVEDAWRDAVGHTGISPKRAQTETSSVSPQSTEYPELPELVEILLRARYASASRSEVTPDDADRAEHLAAAISARAAELRERVGSGSGPSSSR